MHRRVGLPELARFLKPQAGLPSNVDQQSPQPHRNSRFWLPLGAQALLITLNRQLPGLRRRAAQSRVLSNMPVGRPSDDMNTPVGSVDQLRAFRRASTSSLDGRTGRECGGVRGAAVESVRLQAFDVPSIRRAGGQDSEPSSGGLQRTRNKGTETGLQQQY